MTHSRRGCLIVIKRNGSDGYIYFLEKDRHVFGRDEDCDCRIHVQKVSARHCEINFGEDGKAYLEILDNSEGSTYLNGNVINGKVPICHKDIITIVERSFRFEYPSTSQHLNRPNDIPVTLLKILTPIKKYYNKSPLKNFLQSPKKSPSGQLDMRDSIGDKFESSKVRSRKRMSNYDDKRRRVTFGPILSPEQFDKNLPSCTPIRKGSLPGKKKRGSNVPMSDVFNSFNYGDGDIVIGNVLINTQKEVGNELSSSKRKSFSEKENEKTCHLSPAKPVALSYVSKTVITSDESVCESIVSENVKVSAFDTPLKDVCEQSNNTTSEEKSDKSVADKVLKKTPKRKSFLSEKPVIKLEAKKKITPLNSFPTLETDKISNIPNTESKQSAKRKNSVQNNIVIEERSDKSVVDTIVLRKTPKRKSSLSDMPVMKIDTPRNRTSLKSPSCRETDKISNIQIAESKQSIKRRSSQTSAENNTSNEEKSDKPVDDPIVLKKTPKRKSRVSEVLRTNIGAQKNRTPLKLPSLFLETSKITNIQNTESKSAKRKSSQTSAQNKNNPSEEKLVKSFSDSIGLEKAPERKSSVSDLPIMKIVTRKSSTPLKTPSASLETDKINILNSESKQNSKQNSSQSLLFVQSKPLFSEILKQGKSPRKSWTKVKGKQVNFKSNKIRKHPKEFVLLKHPKILALGSTGHVNSPETIIIRKNLIPNLTSKAKVEEKGSLFNNFSSDSNLEPKPETTISTPVSTIRRSSRQFKVSPNVSVTELNKSASKSPKEMCFENISEMTSTPPSLRSDRISDSFLCTVKNKNEKQNITSTAVENLVTEFTPTRLTRSSKLFVFPNRESKLSPQLQIISPVSIKQRLTKSVILNEMNISTPMKMKSASPTLVRSTAKKNIDDELKVPENELQFPSNKAKKIASTTTKVTHNSGTKRLYRSESNATRVKRLSAKSPKSDYTNVLGVKRLLSAKSPKSNYTDVTGVKKLLNDNSPKSDYTNVTGVKKLLNDNSPKSDYTNILGVKLLLSKRSPKSDYTNVLGVKQLLNRKSPKSDYTNVSGVKRLLNSKSPKSDYGNVSGVKQLLNKKSPKSDYGNVTGVKRLLNSKSPKSDYTNVSGIEDLFSVKSPNFDSGENTNSIISSNKRKGLKLSNSDENLPTEVMSNELNETKRTNEIEKPASETKRRRIKPLVDSSINLDQPITTRSRRNNRKSLKLQQIITEIKKKRNIKKGSKASKTTASTKSEKLQDENTINATQIVEKSKKLIDSKQDSEISPNENATIEDQENLVSLRNQHSSKKLKIKKNNTKHNKPLSIETLNTERVENKKMTSEPIEKIPSISKRPRTRGNVIIKETSIFTTDKEIVENISIEATSHTSNKPNKSKRGKATEPNNQVNDNINFSPVDEKERNKSDDMSSSSKKPNKRKRGKIMEPSNQENENTKIGNLDSSIKMVEMKDHSEVSLTNKRTLRNKKVSVDIQNNEIIDAQQSAKTVKHCEISLTQSTTQKRTRSKKITQENHVTEHKMNKVSKSVENSSTDELDGSKSQKVPLINEINVSDIPMKTGRKTVKKENQKRNHANTSEHSQNVNDNTNLDENASKTKKLNNKNSAKLLMKNSVKKNVMFDELQIVENTDTENILHAKNSRKRKVTPKKVEKVDAKHKTKKDISVKETCRLDDQISPVRRVTRAMKIRQL